MSRRFYIVDVFAERPYAGNPLAVVVGAACLSPEHMQQVAVETNYSETTFVTAAPEIDGGYRVRMFTPAREVAFAGHPILGTAWVVRHHVAPEVSGPVRLNLAVGPVSVTFESSADGGEVAWFLAPPVSLGPTCAPEEIAAALGISREDIESGRRSSKFPPAPRSSSSRCAVSRRSDAASLISRRLLLWQRLVFRRSFTSSVARRITRGTTYARGSFSRRMASAKTQPPEMAQHSSARTCWSIGSFPQPIFHCGSSKVTRFVALPWSCCAREWSTGPGKYAWAAM